MTNSEFLMLIQDYAVFAIPYYVGNNITLNDFVGYSCIRQRCNVLLCSGQILCILKSYFLCVLFTVSKCLGFTILEP